MKQRDEQWVWLTAAALDCRDAIRSQILPKLDKAAELEGDELHANLSEIREIASRHGERLRLAIKGRVGDGRQRIQDNPVTGRKRPVNATGDHPAHSDMQEKNYEQSNH